jgi:hypothetical protein
LANNINILNSPITTRQQRVEIKSRAALKVPCAYRAKSGRLRPAKFIWFRDFALPVPSTLFKSPPTSSAFFTIYKSTKTNLEYHAYCENINRYVTDCFAVYMGHTASCGVRVPVDVTKQYARSPGYANMNVFKVVNKMLCSNNNIGEQVLRQFATTVIREIPFCSIKFPLWEFLYVTVENHKAKQNKNIEWYESAFCGSFAGGTAAAITTPIDIAYKNIKVNNVDIFTLFSTFSTLHPNIFLTTIVSSILKER